MSSASSSFRSGQGRVDDGREVVEGWVEMAGRNTTVAGHVVNADGTLGRKVERTYNGRSVTIEWQS